MSVHILENIINRSEAEEIVLSFKDILKPVGTRPGFYEDLSKRDILPYKEALDKNISLGQSQEEAAAAAKVSSLLLKIKEELQNFYNIELTGGEGGLAKLITGASNGLHSDMYQSDGSKWNEVSNRGAELQHSALLYLSDHGKDFTGGEIIFPQHDLSIKPKVGMLVFFRGDREHFHEVSKVLSGERHCIVSFFGEAM
jgi:hypothetical protein